VRAVRADPGAGVHFTGGNFKNILTQTVIVAVGALGMTLIIVGGGIDLSVGSVVAFTGVLGAKLLVAGWSPLGHRGGARSPWAARSGCSTAPSSPAFRMMPFIVTLGMMGIVARVREMARSTTRPSTPRPNPPRSAG
jgi:ribose transport system permease protein